ncbi:hypothetical protein GCM10009867_05040 [Pedococcus aerophilus]|uniref:Uncharacterized protein n=1 Tax=Pedococcus aerophilus TaxID=436356 RepID=A0ABN3UEV4_9MICO
MKERVAELQPELEPEIESSHEQFAHTGQPRRAVSGRRGSPHTLPLDVAFRVIVSESGTTSTSGAIGALHYEGSPNRV